VTRDERLLVLTAELRAAAPAPLRARALAERLAVTERTVQRDIAALARSGLPVRRIGADGYAVSAAARPGGVAVSADSVPRVLTEAVRARRVVRISYVDRAGERTRRDVEAHGLVLAPAGDYLVGWCRMRDDVRHFRVDRVAAAYLTEDAAGPRDLDLAATLPVPDPRPAAGAGPDTAAPARARDWTLDRIGRVRLRVADLAGQADAGALRAVLGHLAEWTRWQVAAVRAVATGQDMVFDGRRPDFPREFDDALGYEARERMIQEAMAPRSPGELAGDLDEVLGGAARWAAGCPHDLWRDPVPEPGRIGRSRPLADLLAGWWSPLSHVEWHLDRPAEDEPGRRDEADGRLVRRCPLRT
jgi:hypothetical protein